MLDARVVLLVEPSASRGGGSKPRWSADGSRLYFVRGTELQAVDVELNPTPRISKARTVVSGWDFPSAIRIYTPMPDGSGILIGRDVQRAEGDASPPEIHVVENWLSDE